MLHYEHRDREMQNAKRKMQNSKLANDRWPMANSIKLSHPDFNRRYRNFTDSVLLGSPIY